MSDAVLRAIVKVCVVLAFLVLTSLFFFIRNRSRKAKFWMLGTVVALVLMVVAYGFVRNILSKRPDPAWARNIAAIEDLIRERHEQIDRVRGRLTSLEEMVSGGDWVPEGEAVAPKEGSAGPLYWAFQLRGAGHAEFGDPSSDLDELEGLFACVGHPELIPEYLGGSSPEPLAAILDRADAPLATVVEIVSAVKPEVKNIQFRKDGSVTGDFSPGRVEFRLAVVDTATGEVVAHGGGAATSGDKVAITGAPDVLMSDLRSQTRKAVIELGRRLMQSE